jgi:tetratricopeptide (TPR) repeat protein
MLQTELGDWKTALNRLEEALNWYSKALTTAPKGFAQAELHQKIGEVLLVQNKKTEAIKRFEMALQTDTNGVLVAALKAKITSLGTAVQNHPKFNWRVPSDHVTVSHENHCYINMCIAAPQPVTTKILVNGMQFRNFKGSKPVKSDKMVCSSGIAQLVDLKEGENRIVVEVSNTMGIFLSEERVVNYQKERPKQNFDTEPARNGRTPLNEVDTVNNHLADKRLALVVGNAAYKDNALKNPLNDARAMQTILKTCGFEVILLENVTSKTLTEQVQIFSSKLKNYGSGLFFYAGHGIEINGVNYILPTDVKSDLNQATIDKKCVKTDWIQENMVKSAGEGKCHILILDACRENPFASQLGVLQETWSIPKNVPLGVITCYATSQGATAADGIGNNGLYTSVLLKHIKTPGLTIEQVFKRVRIDLKKQGGQEPIESTKLTQDFYFIR